MSFKKALGWVRAFGIGTFFLLLSFALLNGLSSIKRSSERTRAVQAALVQQYSHLIQGDDAVEEASLSVQKQAGWPDDFIGLQRWLILDLSRHQAPADTLHRLDGLIRGHLLSPVLRTSLDRWRSSLRAWAEQSEGQTPDLILRQARRRFFEASGYQKIGRQYDATVLYLWSNHLFQRYVALRPQSPEIAEVIYHIGASMIQFRHALPSIQPSERLLKFCAEFYPNTIWAREAISLWRLERPTERRAPSMNERAMNVRGDA